jgi:hypothetical protein
MMPERLVRRYKHIDDYTSGMNQALAQGYAVESTTQIDERTGGGCAFWACLILGLFTLIGFPLLLAVPFLWPRTKTIITVTYLRKGNNAVYGTRYPVP